MHPGQEEQEKKPIPLPQLCQEAKGIISSVKGNLGVFEHALDNAIKNKRSEPFQRYLSVLVFGIKELRNKRKSIEKELRAHSSAAFRRFLKDLWPRAVDDKFGKWEMQNVAYEAKNIYIYTDLNVDNIAIKSLPENLVIKGTLRIEMSGIGHLPDTLEVQGGISVNKNQLKEAQRLKDAGKIAGKIIVA